MTSNNSNNFQKNKNYSQINIKNLTDKLFPPCIKLILNGMKDGRKRALFVLINFFRTLNLDKDELEKRIYDWNKKNTPELKQGYIKSQLTWSYSKKPLLPPNCKEYYQNLGVCKPDNLCKRIKNPVNYPVLKDKIENPKNSKKKTSKKKITKKKKS